jgi:hypothetical protein
MSWAGAGQLGLPVALQLSAAGADPMLPECREGQDSLVVIKMAVTGRMAFSAPAGGPHQTRMLGNAHITCSRQLGRITAANGRSRTPSDIKRCPGTGIPNKPSAGTAKSGATAKRHLSAVVERARGYNAEPGKLLAVAEIAVFGSYLDDSVDRLGDLDLAVTMGSTCC